MRISARDVKIFSGAFICGSLLEFALIKSGFYEQLRLSESRRRAQDNDDIEDAIERLSQMKGFENIKERWERVKDL